MEALTVVRAESRRHSLVVFAGVMVLGVAAWCRGQDAWPHNGGGGAGEAGTATHQHLDSRFAHNRYY